MTMVGRMMIRITMVGTILTRLLVIALTTTETVLVETYDVADAPPVVTISDQKKNHGGT